MKVVNLKNSMSFKAKKEKTMKMLKITARENQANVMASMIATIVKESRK